MSGENQLIPKLPKKVAVYFSLTFLAPIFNSFLTMEYFKVLTFKEIFIAFWQPIPIVLSLLLIACLIYCYVHTTKKILHYDGSKESIIKTNKTIKKFEVLSILCAVLNGPMVSAIIAYACHRAGIEFDTVPVFLISMAGVGLFATFFYICFLQNFEKSMSMVPYSKEFESLPLNVRSVPFKQLVTTLFGVVNGFKSIIIPS